MELEFDVSEDYVVVDNLESCHIEHVLSEDGTYEIDVETFTYHTTRADHEKQSVADNCLFRLVSDRNQALVKQVFQRGVALASSDFHTVDTVVEMYQNEDGTFPVVEVEDVLIRDRNGNRYGVIAVDFSTFTNRMIVAVRRNT